MIVFEELILGNRDRIQEMSLLASAIVKEHYDPILGAEQNDYMIEKFQSAQSIEEQLEHGYRYFFVSDEGEKIGFMAFYPRDSALYLSKFYLKKEHRGRGCSKQMLAFLSDRARDGGLDRIELNVNRFNRSLDIYRKLGFEIIRAEKIDIGRGYYMDDYVCSLKL